MSERPAVVLPSDWAERAAVDLVQHLKARTMAGLPHIGVLGTVSRQYLSREEPDEPSDIEEDEYTIPTDSEESETAYPDWKFIPNKLAFQVTLEPKGSDPLVTKAMFYVRLREGCDGDVSAMPGDRPREYCLTEDELLACFARYDVIIRTDASLGTPSNVEITLDGRPDTTSKVSIQSQDASQEVNIEIRNKSDVFLYYQEGQPRLTRQFFHVKIVKRLAKTDNLIKSYVEFRNLSPRTQRSVIPLRKRDDATSKVEAEQESLERLKESVGESELWTDYHPRFFKVEKNVNNPEGNRYGYLMELEAIEMVKSKRFPYSESDAARTVNAVMDDRELAKEGDLYLGCVTFRDHVTFLERVPVMTPGSRTVDFFAQLGLDKRLAETFSHDLGFETLWRFQAQSITKILDASKTERLRPTVLMSARTAGGKTEAFLIPILQYCIEHLGSKGTKALVFYPTKALANDQTNRYIEVLYHLNKKLPRKLTLGLLHGDISKFEPDPGSEEDWDLPLACPVCDTGILKAEEALVLKCDSCGEVIDFVKVRNRLLVYSDPPDILITNPDTLIWDLMVKPHDHSILGRPVYACQQCKWTYVAKGKKRRCENQRCRSNDLLLVEPCLPRFIVFDEVHMFKGTFGINCSHFISRLETTISRYAQEFHRIDSWKIVRVGATATISNPNEFAKDFFKAAPADIALVPKDDDERRSFYTFGDWDTSVKRHHVFIMPYAYNTDSIIGRTIHYLQLRARLGRPPFLFQSPRDSWGDFLETITFVNSIRSSNNLIGLTRRTVANELPDLKVNGHTTDFDRKQRGRIERLFNRDELHVIFATQTLEVGIDFRRVDVVIVNGFPFSFNDYLQRIGRGGRKRDSLVVTVCQNWKPIDHYYYTNAKEALRDPTAHIEPVPLTRNNVEALKKHARGAVFDYLMAQPECTDYLDDFRSLRALSNMRQQIVDYCFRSLEVSRPFEAEIREAINEFLDELITSAANEIATVALPKRFHETINQKYQLTSLRSTDREVMVEVIWAR
jgi:superfamily II DNA/RNA helicase